MADERRFVIVINGSEHAVSESVVEGLQIRVLGRIEPDTVLIVEGLGKDPDLIVQDTDRIDLTKGPVRVFAMPQTTFG